MTADTLRYPLALLGGIVFATLLFAIMQWLLLRPAPPASAAQTELLVERVRLREPAQPQTPPPQQTLPPKKRPPARPAPVAPSQAVPATPVALTGPLPLTDIGNLALAAPHRTGKAWAPVDSSLVILNRIEPVYPPAAARRGIEGWVRLRFSVDPDGRVRDATIVEAQPPNLFDRAALQAVQQWRFKPRRVEGQAVTTPVVQTLSFTLDT